MNVELFNKKYQRYLQEGYYGLDINNQEVIEYLDNVFKDLTKIPGFKYSQIKTKFNSVRFYSNLESSWLSNTIENRIKELLEL